MIYAIYNALDNANSFEFISSKKVKQQNIFHIDNLNQLGTQLRSGDIVICVDINRFQSVSVFQNFYYFCIKNGISFSSLAQSYLSFGTGKSLKPSYSSFIVFLACLEVEMIKNIQSLPSSKGTEKSLAMYISSMFINLLGQIFSSEGIIKR